MKKIFFSLVVLIIFIPTLKVLIPQIRYVLDWQNQMNKSDVEKLKVLNTPVYNLKKYIDEKTDAEDKFLVFRLSDFMYYVERNVIVYTDPRLVPLYKLRSKKALFDNLHDLEITYIYVPPYLDPSIYNTEFLSLLSDFSLVDIKASFDGHTLYELRKTRHTVKSEVIEIKNTVNFYDYSPAEGKKILTNELGGLAFIKDTIRGHGFFSGSKDLSYAKNAMKIDKNLYKIGVNLKGRGYVKVEVIEYDIHKNAIVNHQSKPLRMRLVINWLINKMAFLIEYIKALKKLIIDESSLSSEKSFYFKTDMDFKDVHKVPVLEMPVTKDIDTLEMLYKPTDKAEYMNIVFTNMGTYGSIEFKGFKVEKMEKDDTYVE